MDRLSLLPLPDRPTTNLLAKNLPDEIDPNDPTPLLDAAIVKMIQGTLDRNSKWQEIYKVHKQTLDDIPQCPTSVIDAWKVTNQVEITYVRKRKRPLKPLSFE